MSELQKLENKVVLLDEILDKVDVERNERYAPGDVHDVSTLLLDYSKCRL